MGDAEHSHFQRTLGLSIQKRRIDVRMTQEFLAERADVSLGYIKKIEQGSRMPKLPVFKKIAEILGITTDELLNFESNIDSQYDEPSILESYYLKLTPLGRKTLISIADKIVNLEQNLERR